jgi:molybdopterin synthase catalytic subunit
MNHFSLQETPLEPARLAAALRHPSCGGYATFEGAVRNHNEGRTVLRLEYEAFVSLALREGERILAAARSQFGLEHAACAHRVGTLEIGDLAVWVGVGAAHRGEAFDACRYIIDHIKHSVPIWKKEYYTDGDSGWVNCEQCAAASGSHQPGSHQHAKR